MVKKKLPVKKQSPAQTTVYVAAKKEKEAKFPNISRFITERVALLSHKRVPLKVLISSVLSFLFVLVIMFQAVMLFQTWQKFSTIQAEKARLYQEVGYWQDVTGKFANYRDGYFSLAVLYYRLGNDEKARENIEKVLSIDPRFEQGIALSMLLEKK